MTIPSYIPHMPAADKPRLPHIDTTNLPRLATTVPHGQATEHIEQAWGVTLTPHPAIEEHQARIAKLRAYYTEHSRAERDFAAVTHTDAKNFDKRLKEVAANRAKYPFTDNEIEAELRKLDGELLHIRDRADYHEHILNQLDTSTVADNFADAVQQLGEDAFDIAKAAQRNPEATHTLQVEGRKLALLKNLFDQTSQRRPEAALYLNLDNVPQLTATEERRNRAVFNNEDHITTHKLLKQAVRQIDNLDLFLIHAAAGTYPHTTLDVATTYTEYSRRRAQIDQLGTATITRLDGTTETRNI